MALLAKIIVSFFKVLGLIIKIFERNRKKDIYAFKEELIEPGYAGKIITDDKNPHPLLDILWKIQKKCEHGGKLEQLTSRERVIYLTDEVNGQVHSSGFCHYFFYPSGANSKEAIMALKEIGAPYTASLVQEAKNVYRNGFTHCWKNPPEDEVELTDEEMERLDTLDNKFYEYRENLDELQMKYIKEHIEDF